jgi:hypothetical protein
MIYLILCGSFYAGKCQSKRRARKSEERTHGCEKRES